MALRSQGLALSLVGLISACGPAPKDPSVSSSSLATPKLSEGVAFSELCGAAGSVPDEYLIRTKSGRSAMQTQGAFRLGLSRHVESLRTLEVNGRTLGTEILKARGLDAKQVLKTLMADDEIAFAEPNCLVHSQRFNDTYYKPDGTQSSGAWNQPYADLWGLAAIQAEAAWNLSMGENVVVAISDTGIDHNHPDIAANIYVNPNETLNGLDDDGNGLVDDIRGWDFLNNDNDPFDDNAHGTHVAGTVAAVGDNNLGIVGVAPKAKVMALKGLGATGSGSLAALLATINYARSKNVDVINMSWGGPGMVNSHCLALDEAAAAGVIPVAAAGNDALDAGGFNPANCNSVITVASLGQNDVASVFSNFGSVVDVGAPGGGDSTAPNGPTYQNILSLLSSGAFNPISSLIVGNTPGQQYYRIMGTSMAAPHVAGVVALMKSQRKALTLGEARDMLRQTATALASDPQRRFGMGKVNAWEAMRLIVPNRSPVFEGLEAVYQARAGEALEIAFSVTDPDGEEVEVTPELLPQDATFDPEAGLLRWTPTAQDVGKSFQIRFAATDQALITQHTANILVRDSETTGGDAGKQNLSAARVESGYGVAGCQSGGPPQEFIEWLMLLICALGCVRSRRRRL